jgi:hypothetical protein
MFSSLVGVMLIFQACGGGASTGGGTPSPPAPVSLTISPASASVEILAKQQFQASVFGSSDTRVLWNVNGNAGGNQSTGLIDANGLYTAPALVPNPAVVSIVAVSVADRTRNAAAAVNITSPVTVRVNPVNANVGVGGTQQFTAAVSGVSNQAVNWSVNHKPGGDPSCGKIDKNGLYSAPLTIPNPPTVTVTAISQVDWRQQATATVSIAAIGISLSPSSASVYTNGTQQFTASVTGTPITQVDWKVNGVTGGNAAVGTISSAGLYTAPTFLPSPSTVTVTAVSQADTSKSASAAVTILPSTPLGTFTISITASAGPVTRNRNLSLSIVP